MILNPSRPLRMMLAGGAVVMLVACQPDAQPADPRPPATGAPVTATPLASPPARTATDAGLTARQRLTLLADTVASTPQDSSTDLPYEYVHTQNWHRVTDVISRTDRKRWRHTGDNSGVDITRTAPTLRGVDHQPTRQERSLFADAKPETTHWLPGELHSYIPEQGWPADVDSLIARLVPPIPATEPTYPRVLANSVINIAIYHHLDRSQRAALLRVLAAVPGITYQATTTDLAGRAGMSFQVVADRSTVKLIIDPVTGELLSAGEWVDGFRPGLFGFVLIVGRGHVRTDHDIVPPAGSDPTPVGGLSPIPRSLSAPAATAAPNTTNTWVRSPSR
ncbi:hypothetical protein ACQPYA_04205 [Micromonospora sp. CA-263727]|uniref:hypothetical protein n=1 Tax=Micromonospora sp. CA-263727 TaxID=3239967 RepID=UPI003D8F036D